MNDAVSILDQLRAVVGGERCLPGETGAAFYTDVYRALETPLAVLRPSAVEEVQAVLRLAQSHGLAVSVRGGGASYTDGYLAQTARTLLLDLSAMDRIIEINERDAWVKVEAGVTWAALSEALAQRGWRTPFRGPFSGYHATVGGSVSQNALSHGSGAWGISAESVLSLDLVLADGSLLSTGSAAATDSPFARYFGPDLTGLFTGDCGVLAVKVAVTLPLIRRRPAHRVVSFAFPDFAAMHGAMADIAAERLEDSQFALDQALSQGQIARQDQAGAQLQMAWSLLRSSPSLAKGIAQLLRAASSARRELGQSAYMTHYIVEGVDDGEARGRLHRIREIAVDHGTEIAATVPGVVRDMPFAPFFNTLGPAGERWVPLHGILPHSKVPGFHAALQALFAARASEMDRLGIWQGTMFSTVGSSGFLYEIALYWPDEITAYHRSVVPADYLAGLPEYAANEEARAAVHALKSDLIALYVEHGAVNFQLGRAYPYAQRLAEAPRALLRALKDYLDPQGRLTPGGLGLSGDSGE